MRQGGRSSAGSSPDVTLVHDLAQLTRLDGAWSCQRVEGGAWQTVRVPEEVPFACLGPRVRYRHRIALDTHARAQLSVLDGPLAISVGYSDASAQELIVDGQPLGGRGTLGQDTGRPAPVVYDLPPALLADGELELEVRSWVPAPLADSSWFGRLTYGPFAVGPRDAVAAVAELEPKTDRPGLSYRAELIIASVDLVLMLLFGLLWWRHRERSHRDFALLALWIAAPALVMVPWKEGFGWGPVWVTQIRAASEHVIAVLVLQLAFDLCRRAVPRWARIAQALLGARAVLALPVVGAWLLPYLALAGPPSIPIAFVLSLGVAWRHRRLEVRVFRIGIALGLVLGVLNVMAMEGVVPLPGVYYTQLGKAEVSLMMALAVGAQFSSATVAAGRFVPARFLALLGRPNVVDVERGDAVELEQTVLFADMRGFTSLAESLGPQETFAFMNEYHALMEPLVVHAGGFINQYYGDGIMALFPTPRAAVEAARAMQAALPQLNRPVKVGIGIHVGSLILGTIGGEERLDTGLVGDTVNAAARLEQKSKELSAPIIISDAVRAQLDGLEVGLREVGTITLRGRSTETRLFAVDGDG